jgi:NAD(P)-dependent dehydrogenase (short-subunit alcohol dehydrogenase family)
MIYVIGSNSHVINSFILENRKSVVCVGRNRNSGAVDFVWDLADSILPDSLAKTMQQDNNISIVYCAAFKSEKLLVSESLENIKLSISVNYLSYVSLLKFVLPLMIKSAQGKIIYLGSSYAEKNSIGASIYGSTKTASAHLTETIAKEYARFGIQANTVMLGFFDGPLWKSIPDNQKKNMLTRLPCKSLGTGEQLQILLNFLLNEAQYMSGQKIYIDGGLS